MYMYYNNKQSLHYYTYKYSYFTKLYQTLSDFFCLTNQRTDNYSGHFFVGVPFGFSFVISICYFVKKFNKTKPL